MKKSISIRWKILFYISIFSIALFAFLWLFQTVLLDRFYETIREKQISRVASTISLSLNDESNLETIMQKQAVDNEACIRVVSTSEVDITAGNPLSCKVNRLSSQEITTYVALAMNNGGTYLEKKAEKQTYNTIFGPINVKKNDSFDLIHTTIAYQYDALNQMKNPVLILVSGRLSPVNATITTLKVQLYFIAGIFAIAAALLSSVITSKIVKPLEKITQSALVLATGNYDVRFDTEGFKEVKELSDTLNYAADKLKEVDQMRKDLIANVSHDLRTPLTMIRGYGEMIRDFPEEYNEENAQVIIDETKRLTALVNDLLDLSKMQANQIGLNIEQFDLSQCILNSVKKYRKLMADNEIELITENDCSYWVKADKKRIEQVLDNFIINAVHYGRQGKKIIIRQIEKKDTIRVEVQDFGAGIAEEQLPLIWDRYYKIDKQHIRNGTGSGIGLSIVKEILKLHQVDFGVQSKLNEGSLFYFELKKVKK